MKRFAGESTFVWFLATIVNVNDPDRLGQCQIRVDNLHDDYEDEDLPWAMPLMPITSASYQTAEFGEVGTSPTGIMVGSYVFGFFADGSSSTTPVIVGTIPAIKDGNVEKHDVPKEAREINTWKSKPVLGPEPESSYAAKYPFNKVTRTMSGHTIEIDDTPNAERIHVYHKSGTYIEISSDGKTVTKINGDNYKILAKNDEVYIEGNQNKQIKGSLRVHINGNVDMSCDGNLNLNSSGPAKIESQDSVTLKAPTITISESGSDPFRNR